MSEFTSSSYENDELTSYEEELIRDAGRGEVSGRLEDSPNLRTALDKLGLVDLSPDTPASALEDVCRFFSTQLL